MAPLGLYATERLDLTQLAPLDSSQMEEIVRVRIYICFTAYLPRTTPYGRSPSLRASWRDHTYTYLHLLVCQGGRRKIFLNRILMK